MEVDEKLIEYTAELSKLILTEEEKKKMTTDMADIITWFDKLKELDMKGVSPMEHVVSLENALRRDSANNSFDRDEILANAPLKSDGYFKVPKIVD